MRELVVDAMETVLKPLVYAEPLAALKAWLRATAHRAYLLNPDLQSVGFAANGSVAIVAYRRDGNGDRRKRLRPEQRHHHRSGSGGAHH